MPQLDSFTYLTQVVWLCVFLFTYYILLLNNALPRISRLLKLRKQLTAGSAVTESQTDAQTLEVQGSNPTALLTGRIVWDMCRLSREFLSQTVQYSMHWYNQQLSKMNIGQFQKLHKNSVAFIGQLSLWQVLTSQLLSLEKAVPLTNRKEAKIFALALGIGLKRCFSKTAKKKESAGAKARGITPHSISEVASVVKVQKKANKIAKTKLAGSGKKGKK